jgi:hypothetical protein
MELTDGLAYALGAVLALAAVAKLARARVAAEALAPFGLRGRRQMPALVALALVELGIAGWLAAGGADAAYAAAALFLGFAIAVAIALRAGRGGAPCPCFGAGSQLGPATLRRCLALAALAAALPAVRAAPALAVSTCVLAALLLLPPLRRPARPRGALEIAWEGPAVGSRPPALQGGTAALQLAVFLSEACPPCQAAAAAAAAFADHPAVTVHVYDEVRDRARWLALDVPGAPYAIATDDDGVVRAKGTFNTAAQLESILATAERRAAAGSSRRRFLAGAARLVAAGTAMAALAPGEAAGHHFCGHTYTTGSCPHPTGLPRVDRDSRPLRAADGRPVDDLGRLVDGNGRPVDEQGAPLRDPSGNPLPPAPRSKLCLELVADRYGFRTWLDGSWHRCCGGRVRKLMDCCSYSARRINGDGALTGYCFRGRRVFCVFYYQTEIPC